MATIADERNRVAAEQWKNLNPTPDELFEELSYPEKQERVALYQQAAESAGFGDLFTDVSFAHAVRELSDDERRELQREFDRINDSNDRFEWDADRQMRVPMFGELSLDEFKLAQGQARSDWKHLNPTPDELFEEQAAEWRKTQLPLDTPVPEDAAIDIQAIEEEAARLNEMAELERNPVEGHGASVMRPPKPSRYVEKAGRHISPTGEYFTTEDEIVEYQKPGWGVEKAVAQSIVEALMPPGVAQAYDLAYLANETEKFSKGEVGWSAPATAGIAFLPLGDLLKIPGRVGAAMRRSLKNHPDNPIFARQEAMDAVNSSTRNIDPKTGIGDPIPGRKERLHARLDELSDDNRELHTLANEDNAWKARNEGWETDPQYALQGEGTLGETGADILAGKSEVLDAEDIAGLKAETADVELDLKQRTQATAARALARENEAAKALSERVRQRDLDDFEEAQDAATANVAAIEKAGAERQRAAKDNTARLEEAEKVWSREVKAGQRAKDRGEKAIFPGGPTRRPLVERTSTEPTVTGREETGLAVRGDESLATMSPKERSLAVSANQFPPGPSVKRPALTGTVEDPVHDAVVRNVRREEHRLSAGQAPPDVTPAADLPPRPRRSDELASFEQGAAAHLEKGRQPKPAPDAESVDDAVTAASKPRGPDGRTIRSRPPSEDATPDELAAWWDGQHELPIGDQDLAGMQRVADRILERGGTRPKAWSRPLIQPDSPDYVRKAEAEDLLESGEVWANRDPRGDKIWQPQRDLHKREMELWVEREMSVMPAADRQMDTVRLFNEKLENLSAHGWEGWSGAPARRTTGVEDITEQRTKVAAKHAPKTEEVSDTVKWEEVPVSDDVAPVPQAKVDDAATTKATADKAAAAATKRANKRRAAGKYDSTDFGDVGVGEIEEKTVVNFRNSQGMFNPDDVSTVIRVQKTKKGDVLTIKDADGNKVQLYAREVRALKPGRDLPQSAAEAAEEALTARDILGGAVKRSYKSLKKGGGPRRRAVGAVGLAGIGAVAGGVTVWNRAKDKKERTAMYDGLSTEFGMVPSLEHLPEYSNPFHIIEEGEEITPRPMHFLLEELLDERGTKLTRDDVANATYEKFDDYIQTHAESERFREMVGHERPTVLDLIQVVELLQSPELAEDKLTPAQKKKKKKWENEVRRTLRGFYTFDKKQKARITEQEEGG